MSDSGNGTYTAPYAVLTPTDHGGRLVIAAILTLAVTIISIGLRIHTLYRNPRRTLALYKADILCFTATLFCVIQCALVWAGVVQGNGKAIDLISSQHLDHVQRIQYAVDIFYITILFCSRASVIFLLERLQGLGMKPIWIYSLAILSLWFIASVFAVALKCNLSHPWIQYNVQCTGLLSRWQAIEILGIIIECAIFGLAIHLVYIGRMSVPSRVKIVVLFTTRVVVIICAALRITYLSEYFHSTNPTYSGVATAIYALAEANASVVTATTPLLKAFILKFKYNTVVPRPPPISRVGKHTEEKASESTWESHLSEHERPTSEHEKPTSEHEKPTSEHEKPTAASSSGTGDYSLSV